MAKDCRIHYELTQVLYEDSETQSFFYDGKILKSDQKFHLHYSFEQEGISTDVLMEIGNKSITVKQNGGISSRITYIPGQTTDMTYQTPTGKFAMKCTTNSYHLKSDENAITVILSYDLYTNNELLCSNKLKICITL